MMLESMKKTFLAGLGVVAFTREKLDQTIQSMVGRGELTKDQGKKVLQLLLERGDTEGKQIIEKMSHELRKILELGPLATKGQLRELEDRVERLEGSGTSSTNSSADGGATL